MFIFLKKGIKDLFLFQDAIQQHYAKLFHKRVRILRSVFSRRRLCGKACGKCGSSENINCITQQGTEIQEPRRSQQSEQSSQQYVRASHCIFKGFKLHVLSLSFLRKLSLPQIQSQKGSLKTLKPPLKSSHWPNMRSTN